MLLRDEEHVVRLNDQPFCDQFNRHFREAREDLMQQGREGPYVINDDDCDIPIGRQVLEQPGIGIETSGSMRPEGRLEQGAKQPESTVMWASNRKTWQ